MGTITLDLSQVRSLDIGDRLTKLRLDGLLVIYRNAGALTFTGDDALEGLHPADTDTSAVKIGTKADNPAAADAVRALIQVGYPGQSARDAVATAIEAMGDAATTEDLLSFALRNGAKRGASDLTATVVGVTVPVESIVSVQCAKSLTVNLASGRRLAWRTHGETMTDHGLTRLKVLPQRYCKFYDINGTRLVNCAACGGWRDITLCTH